MPPRRRPKRIAFHDTNGLSHLSLYWEACRAGTLRLDAHSDWAALCTALAPIGLSVFRPPHQAQQALRNGQKLFHEMLSKGQDWDYYTSYLCRSELHHLLLEQIAHRRLAGMRVPQRMRTQRPLLVYRHSLTVSDYNALDRQIAEFFDELDTLYGVRIRFAEEEGIDQKAISLAAKAVWSRVLVEVMDGFIYGCAMVTQADVLFSHDEALRDVVNSVAQPQTTDWRAVKASITRELRASLRGSGLGFTFPRARRPQDGLPP